MIIEGERRTGDGIGVVYVMLESNTIYRDLFIVFNRFWDLSEQYLYQLESIFRVSCLINISQVVAIWRYE